MLLVDSPARLCLNRGSRGDIAQLTERSIRIAEVEGLNPSISTRYYYIFIATSNIPVAIFIILQHKTAVNKVSGSIYCLHHRHSGAKVSC